MWRLIYGVPIWVLASPIKLVVIVLGFITVPIVVLAGAYEMTEVRPEGHPKYPDGDKYNFTWKWMQPWDNFEDGIACLNKNPYPDNMFMRICYWSCWRNPANGLRTTPVYSFRVDPKKVNFVGSLPVNQYLKYKGRFPHWYFCWHGPYTCFFWQFKLGEDHMRRLWIGWKLIPQDINGVKEDNYRYLGVAFTAQFKQIHIR